MTHGEELTQELRWPKGNSRRQATRTNSQANTARTMTMVEAIDGRCGSGTKTAPSENGGIAVPALVYDKPEMMAAPRSPVVQVELRYWRWMACDTYV